MATYQDSTETPTSDPSRDSIVAQIGQAGRQFENLTDKILILDQ
jgi:hypothetical protein